MESEQTKRLEAAVEQIPFAEVAALRTTAQSDLELSRRLDTLAATVERQGRLIDALRDNQLDDTPDLDRDNRIRIRLNAASVEKGEEVKPRSSKFITPQPDTNPAGVVDEWQRVSIGPFRPASEGSFEVVGMIGTVVCCRCGKAFNIAPTDSRKYNLCDRCEPPKPTPSRAVPVQRADGDWDVVSLDKPGQYYVRREKSWWSSERGDDEKGLYTHLEAIRIAADLNGETEGRRIVVAMARCAGWDVACGKQIYHPVDGWMRDTNPDYGCYRDSSLAGAVAAHLRATGNYPEGKA